MSTEANKAVAGVTQLPGELKAVIIENYRGKPVIRLGLFYLPCYIQLIDKEYE